MFIKKSIYYKVIMFLIFSILLVGCKAQKPKEEIMFIRPSVSLENINNIDLDANKEYVYFDFTVDDSVKAISISSWTYIENKWQSFTIINNTVKPGKYAIAVSDSKGPLYDFYLFYKNESVKGEFNSLLNLENYYINETKYLIDKTKIELDKEIILWSELSTDQYKLNNGYDDFRDLECEAGVVFTVTFSSSPSQ